MPQNNHHESQPCWRCRSDGPPPTLDQQVEIVRSVHQSWGEPYDWPDAEWLNLRLLMQPGDIIELCRNSFLRMLNPDAQGVLIWRAGTTIRIDRRQIRREAFDGKPKPASPRKPPQPFTDDDDNLF
jgi:hypothetical protein